MSFSILLSSFGAGLLTIFSPCILPLIPFVASSAFKNSRLGPLYLSFGLALSFSLTTYLIVSSGQLLGLDEGQLKILSGLFLLLASLLFIFPALTDWISLKLSPINNKLSNVKISKGPKGFQEFFSGVLLGPVWTPCSGPTLSLVIGLIISDPNPNTALPLLGLFAIGSIIPILFIAYGAKSITNKVKSKALEKGIVIKKVLGVLCAIMAISIITGFDKRIEAFLLKLTPEFITNISLTI